MKIVVAYDLNKTIGIDGKLPWHLGKDFRFFQQLTLHNTVIMGRLTWESLPIKPLPHRSNIVLANENHSLKMRQEFPDISTFPSLEKVLPYTDKNTFIIGGSQVYRKALEIDCVDEMYITLLPQIYNGDCFFPSVQGNWILKDRWKEDYYYRFRLVKE